MLPDDPRHGTMNGYGNLRCRCERCVDAARRYRVEKDLASYKREWMHRTGRSLPREPRLASIEPDHGTESRYLNGCRCEDCRTASADARRARRHADIEASRAYDREYKQRKRAKA